MPDKYNATIAKIRTIYGRRITKNDYDELVSMPTVNDAAEYLKRKTYYSEILSTVDTNTIHRGFLENLLRKSEFETYLKIIKFEGLGKQEFYNYIFIRSEIDEILSCIRGINAKSDQQIHKTQIYYNPYTPLDFLELAKMRTFPDLLKLLRKTPYYGALFDIVPDKNGIVDFSRCEVRMRTYYYNRLLSSIKSHNNEDNMLRFLIKSDIDLINIINSYRLTAFFNENEDVIKSDMLPFSGRLSATKIKDIYSAPTAEEFLKRFSMTYYGKQIIDAGWDIKDIELCLQRLRYKYVKQALRRSDSAPLSVYAFMYLRHLEVKNLISIIEAIRYKLPVSQIESHVLI